VIAIAKPLGVEPPPLDLTWNRVLAAPVIARRSAPEAAVSAIDGYAVRDAALASVSTQPRLVGESFAGSPYGAPQLQAGACVRIFTGAPLLAGADRAVMQECVERQGDAVMIAERPSAARHVRAAGQKRRRLSGGSDSSISNSSWSPKRRCILRSSPALLLNGSAIFTMRPRCIRTARADLIEKLKEFSMALSAALRRDAGVQQQ
jgi:hypothetical protein